MANAALDAQVATIHAESRPSYGRPRIVRALGNRGVMVGHERVRRSLSRYALRPAYQRAVPGDDGFRVCQTGGGERSGSTLRRWATNQA